jgi:hypothetical protein
MQRFDIIFITTELKFITLASYLAWDVDLTGNVHSSADV